MKNKLIICLLAFALMGDGVEAQSYLKKMNDALNKASSKIDKAAQKLDGGKKKKEKKSSSVEDSSNPKRNAGSAYSEYPTEEKADTIEIVGHMSNMYKTIKEDPNGKDALITEYGQFKVTSETKTVTLDDKAGLLLGYFHDGRAFVRTPANGMLCIDQNGNVIKQWNRNDKSTNILMRDGADYPKFDSGRFIIIETEEEYSSTGTAVIYDTDFKVIKRIPNVSWVSNYENGVAIITKNTKGANTFSKSVFIDINGNEIMPKITELINSKNGKPSGAQNRPLCDGLAAFAIAGSFLEKPFWGFRDAKGNVVVKPIYKKVQDFSNGLAAVLVDVNGIDKWGFIDTKGNMVIQPKYTIEPSRFDVCGLAMVVDKDAMCSFINKNGETVSKSYADITPFYNGRAIFTEYADQDITNGKWAIHNSGDRTFLIDSDFNIVATLGETVIHASNTDNGMKFFHKGFDEINNYKFLRYSLFNIGNSFVNGKMYIEIKGEYAALLNETGDISICGITGFFSEGLAPVNYVPLAIHDKRNAVGYVNENGEWIIKFEENNF